MRLPFITFEGTEGCGKSTQLKRLSLRLESIGVPVLATREPGGTPLGEKIRDLLQFAPEGWEMFAETELLLFEASRSQLVRQVIAPALKDGKCVLADRFFDSTTVYQGVARQLEEGWVTSLNRFAVGDCVPDLTIVLDVDQKRVQERLLRRVRPVNQPDRMEAQSDEFYQRVCDAYRRLAEREPGRVCLIDGNGDADKIEAAIWSEAEGRFGALFAKLR